MIPFRQGIHLQVFALFGLALFVGCAQTPLDPATDPRYSPPTFRADHAPYGNLVIRHIRDLRPAREFGRTEHLHTSFAFQALFDRPASAMLKRVFALELERCRVFHVVGAQKDAKYALDIDIRHLYCSWEGGLLSLVPIVPTIDVSSVIDIHVSLVDQDGRRFLEKTFVRNRKDSASTVTRNQVGQEALADLLGQIMAEFLPDADASIPRFWEALGLPIQ